MAAVGQYVGRVVAWSALAGTLVVLLAVPRTNDRLTTYATASPRLADADLIATFALIGGCLVGLVLQPSRPGVVGGRSRCARLDPSELERLAATGPSLLRSIGLTLSPFLVPLLVHVALAAAGRERRWRRTLIALYLAAAAVAVSTGLWYRPYVDATCFDSCYTHNVFLVDSRLDLVRRIGDAWLLGTAAAGTRFLGCRCSMVCRVDARGTSHARPGARRGHGARNGSG